MSKKISNLTKSLSGAFGAAPVTGQPDSEYNQDYDYAQFICNKAGEVEHVILSVNDWEKLSKLDPVYQAKNKMEGLQLNVMLPEGKIVRLPHAVAVMVVKHGEGLLKAWREYRGFKQSDLVEHGIAQPTVHQMEKSSRSRLTTLVSLAKIYGCDLNQLTAYVLKDKDSKHIK